MINLIANLTTYLLKKPILGTVFSNVSKKPVLYLSCSIVNFSYRDFFSDITVQNILRDKTEQPALNLRELFFFTRILLGHFKEN